jgi:hypothetical protein
MIYKVHGLITKVHIVVLTVDIYNIVVFIKSSKLQCCIEYMVMLLRFRLEIQRKYQGTDVVDIDNIDVYLGPLK